MTQESASGAHRGSPSGKAHRAEAWSTSITTTTDEHVYVRGLALDAVLGEGAFPAMVLRLWRGDEPTKEEANLLDACLVASIDHGPLAPSALVTRSIASTRGGAMSGLAGGILSFSDYHGAAVTRAMRILATAPVEGDLDGWADQVFNAERAAGRRVPGIGHRWHDRDVRAERLMELAVPLSGDRGGSAARALAARVSRHTGESTPVNIDAALAVALNALRLDPAFGDFLFALARGFGLAAHYVEEQARQRPMRTIDPTQAQYDGIVVSGVEADDSPD